MTDFQDIVVGNNASRLGNTDVLGPDPARTRTVRTITVVHELSNSITGKMTQTILEPTSLATVLTFESKLIPEYRESSIKSSAHFAVIRRKEINKLIDHLTGLEQHQDELHFATYTQPIFKRVKTLINQTLIDADSEGNTREILRMVRDSLMDQRWNDYKDSLVRERAIKIFTDLCKLETVPPSIVEEARNLFAGKAGFFEVFAEDEDAQDSGGNLDTQTGPGDVSELP